ncbi:fish-egg lectin-like [Brachyistius frenatus]|uniref:fish-egg lectin-like n=1 Tax=Brachyistius frenatus TaxID=100188 RepID=UPI0037E92A90
MKAVAAVLLLLSCSSISHGWTCEEDPQHLHASQIDVGRGQVVMTDQTSAVYFLTGSKWCKVNLVTLKHVSVGSAGIWGVDNMNKVYKYVAGDFIISNGVELEQVDAGGEGQIVGVTSSHTIYCLKSTTAEAYKKEGSVSWDNLPGQLIYFSCSPLNGCWGVNSNHQIYFTKVTSTCDTSGWVDVDGAVKMVEIGTDGSVFVVNANGNVFQRTGISGSLPQGNNWVQISIDMPIKHLSYDLGRIWAVSNSGAIMLCIP